jgi:hypothetical protein
MTTIPTISEIFNNILSDLQAEYGITVNPFGNAFLVALAGVLSGLFYLVYLALGDVQKNIWIDTCDYPTLLRFGRIILGRDPFAATAGQYTATITGSTSAVAGATTVYKSDDSSESPGMLFQISGAYTMPGTTGLITINALAGGLSSRLAIGDTLTATAPLVNIGPTATIATEVVIPVDAEDMEDYRTKCIEKVQLVPGSWSATDYRLVGIGISGVEQTYAYAASGDSNVVDVFLQGTIPGTAIGAGIITDYETAIELVRPLGVFRVDVAASTINTIAITITMGSFAPFTAAQKTAISSALVNFINSVHPFIAGAGDSVSLRNDTIATFNLNSAITAAVPGYGYSAVSFTVGGTPTAVWQADNGEIAYFNGTVAYA